MYQWTWRQEDAFKYPEITISEEEFAQRVKEGEKLVILDNMVLDIGSYAYAHPGGAFLLEHNIGRDISKFVYGAYALDGNGNDPSGETERHAHSNIARKIANRHAVAALKQDAVRWNTGSGNRAATFFKIDSSKSRKINDTIQTFCFSTLDAKVIPGLKHYSTSLRDLGRHYHIVHLGQDGRPFKHKNTIVRRQYTTTNCLEPRHYDHLLELLQPPAADEEPEELDESQRTDGTVRLLLNPTELEKST